MYFRSITSFVGDAACPAACSKLMSAFAGLRLQQSAATSCHVDKHISDWSPQGQLEARVDYATGVTVTAAYLSKLVSDLELQMFPVMKPNRVN